jgi:hypothetical protein
MRECSALWARQLKVGAISGGACLNAFAAIVLGAIDHPGLLQQSMRYSMR